MHSPFLVLNKHFMIYLSKSSHTEVVTDSVTSLVPDKIDVYLDDVLIGNFENLSRLDKYIKFTLPKLDLMEKEYTMKLYYSGTLIKEELVIVKDLSEFKPKSVTNAKQILMYEK